jgi:hypothetical protein
MVRSRGALFVKLVRPACAALGAVASAAALALVPSLPGQAALATSWHVVLTKHYGAAANYSGYSAVVAPSTSDAWVFGTTNGAGLPAPGTPVAERWNGTSWRSSTLPSGLTSEISAASADSSKDVWAVTEVGGDILHWDGTQWSVAEHATGRAGALFTDVLALSPRDVWAFGNSGAGPGLGAWHFDGTSWTHVTGRASGVGWASAVSPTNIWGTGSVLAPGDAIFHYNGTTWRHVTAPALNAAFYPHILALSGTDVWATASTASGKEWLVHLSGGQWTKVTLPWSGLMLEFFAPDGKGGFWLDASARSGQQKWALHYSAAGKWSRTALSPGGMGAIALIPATTSLWGAGGVSTATGANAEIWAHGPAAAAPLARRGTS